MNLNRERQLAKLAVAFAGIAWGLYWVPLRALQAAGLPPFDAFVAFQLVPLAFALPALLLRGKAIWERRYVLLLLGAALSIPMAIYSTALLHTDILRAMVLFYLMPVWSTLLERLVLGVHISRVRALSIGLAAAAMAVMFGGQTGLPWPQNTGDWLALAAGATWSGATVLMHRFPAQRATDLSAVYFLVAAAVTLVLTRIMPLQAPIGVTAAQLWWLVPTTLVIVVSSVVTSMWGVPRISPGLSGLLFMTEIAAGAVSASLWAGEPFGPHQLAGVILIALAGALESIVALVFRQQLPTH